jgi:beta-lactamase superfamily II metal-dependent hydrolase
MKKSSWIRHLQIAILLFLAVSSVAFASENLTAHFIDVGQGDSILLQFDGKNVLIDGGIQEMGPRVETYLRNHGVSSLDLLVATHPHEDHIGGLITILKDFSIKQVLDSGQPDSSQVYETFLTLIDQKNILYKVAQRGQKINLDTNLKIDVLSPPPTLFSNDLNQNSIVLKVTYNKVSFLLMGDAGFEAENSIKAAGYDLKSDILKVGHHGSSSASGTSFLAKVKPAISIIEVGTGNDYGHPTQKTLNALQNIGSEIYRTDTNGNIVITTDGTSYSISSQKLSAVPASTTSQRKPPPILLPLRRHPAQLQRPPPQSLEGLLLALQNLISTTTRAAARLRRSSLQTWSPSPALRMLEHEDMCHVGYVIHHEGRY